FCSVAGLSLKQRRVLNQDEICLGDAITMIPPVTGNGMSLAFESAQLAADPLAAFSAGKCSWPEARRRIAGLCDERFSRRLFWAQQLQQILLSPSRRTLLFHLVSRSDWIWRMTFERTR
ncbi:MAG TPA: hypothetical protein VFV81_08170, partial [Verrucomicrobiae bacterium]|nr:hypothetical protein [Verrucomicrobiae bacterium]